ncbi:transmembrane protease serine 9-like [Hemitrygon akajei]|uniref:transmembrane protease serine 9-like n=1 Tax=Hemitrygon akajei TaxID=2704970 RepID=UPI003BF962BE
MDKMISQLQTALVVLVTTVLANQSYDCSEITGGRKVKPYSRPYMVSIESNNKHVCGGSLIQAKWVLTAASCLQLIKKKKSSVILRMHSHKKEGRTEQKILIKNLFPHPKFKNTLDNDIMLLELQEAASIKSKEFLHLPTSVKDPKSGAKCSIIGWQQTSSKDKSHPDSLKKAEATVIDRKVCNGKKYYNGNPVITDNMICARDKNSKKDSCLVDAGNPLMCKKRALSKEGIVGISTARKDCRSANRTGIYVWLTEKYLSWIKEKIGVVNFSKPEEQICTCVKIVGGHDAKRGTGTYMASIQNANGHMCGGVLIDKQWVLTSANCVANGLTVVIGTRSLKDVKEDNKFKSIETKIHEKYNKKKEWNNLALLKLDKAVKLNKFAKTLWPRSPKDVKPGTNCKVLGWGQTAEDDTDLPDILQETTVIIIDQKTCNSRKYYNKSPVVNDDMLCAAGKSENQAKMCNGDVGGPLICKSQFLKVESLTGIAIFEKGCERKDKPGIYTHLSKKYINWIKKKIKSKTNNTSIEQKLSETTDY